MLSTTWTDSKSPPPNATFLGRLQILIEETDGEKISGEYSRRFEYERGSDGTENLRLSFLIDTVA